MSDQTERPASAERPSPPQPSGPSETDARARFELHYVPHLMYQQPDDSWVREKRRDMMRHLDTMLRAAAEARPGAAEPTREALVELVAAMDRYEADATEPPPSAHVEMMKRARAALSGPATE